MIMTICICFEKKSSISCQKKFIFLSFTRSATLPEELHTFAYSKGAKNYFLRLFRLETTIALLSLQKYSSFVKKTLFSKIKIIYVKNLFNKNN